MITTLKIIKLIGEWWVIQGGRTLDDAAKQLSKRFRFKRFKIQFKKRRFKLLGEFNPWILLAEGDVIYRKKLKNVDGKTARLGDDVKVDGADGIIIGEKNLGTLLNKKGSTFVERYRGPKNKDAAKSKFDDLYAEKDISKRRKEIKGETGKTHEEYVAEFGTKVANTIKGRGNIGKNIGPKPATAKGFDDWNAHHVLPVEAIENSKLLQKAIEQGFEFNGKSNGKWLRRYSSEIRTNPKTGKIIASPQGTHASHDAYNQKVIAFLKKVEKLPNYNPAKAKQFAEMASKSVMKKIDDMLIKNQRHITEQLAKGRKLESIMKDSQIIRINQLQI